QRAEAVTLAARLGKADDDELVALGAFDLEPVGAAAGAIGSVAPLGDRALDVEVAGMPIEIRAAPLLVVAVAHDAGAVARHDLCERRLAVREHDTHQVIAVAVQ